jgi:hypothetical protein
VQDRGRQIAILRHLPNGSNFYFGRAELGEITDPFPYQTAGQGRAMRNCPSGGVSLVFAHDSKGLFPAVRAPNADRTAELHLSCIERFWDYTRTRAPGGPIAQIT